VEDLVFEVHERVFDFPLDVETVLAHDLYVAKEDLQ
jgi:hypothetical protein